MSAPDDLYWMRCALQEARQCLRFAPQIDDVPVGAICVYENQIVGRGHNQRELANDPSAHAEIIALRAASRAFQSSHLNGVTLYATLEPCAMCAGALWLARVSRVVFGAWDEKAGACGSVFDVARDPRLNHRVAVLGGVLQGDCALLLREFFERRRQA